MKILGGKDSRPQEIRMMADNILKLVHGFESVRGASGGNVKDLEKMNQNLFQSEVRYRTLWDHAADSLFIVDESGIIQDMNRRAEAKFGCHKEKIVGTSLLTFIEEEERHRFAQWLHHVQFTGKEWLGGELKVRPKNGDVLILESSLVPMEHTASQTAILLQWRDLTEKKRLERELMRTERLASLSQFASMFAHDIRNPLAGIKKTLELLGQEAFSRSYMHDRIRDMQCSVNLLLGMINDMLDVYQENYTGLPLIISPFRVEDMLEEVACLFKSEARAKEVTIDVNADGNGRLFPGDRRRLQRVVINLLHNALKHSLPGGLIKLSSFIVKNGFLSDDSNSSGSSLVITVEDQGQGIDPRDFPHLFEMFFRKKNGQDSRIGRGLGLYFCKLVVEAHHGRIWAKNRQLEGAEFGVALPLEVKEMAHAY